MRKKTRKTIKKILNWIDLELFPPGITLEILKNLVLYGIIYSIGIAISQALIFVEENLITDPFNLWISLCISIIMLVIASYTFMKLEGYFQIPAALLLFGVLIGKIKFFGISLAILSLLIILHIGLILSDVMYNIRGTKNINKKQEVKTMKTKHRLRNEQKGITPFQWKLICAGLLILAFVLVILNLVTINKCQNILLTIMQGLTG